MNKYKITPLFLKKITTLINDCVKLNHISNITMINSHDLLMTFSMYRKERLFISLNHQSPFISLISSQENVGTIVGQTNDILRKTIKDSFIHEIKAIDNERIIMMHISKTNDYFDKEEKNIIIELIPHCPNFIIISNDNKILFATHYTAIDANHPIVKNFTYHLPSNSMKALEDTQIDISMFQQWAKQQYHEAIKERLREQNKPLLTKIKSRIKSLKSKLVVLQDEIEQATKDLANQEIGQNILALSYDKDSLEEYISSNNINYDRTLTPGINAEKYFKKYKKSKRTIEMDYMEITKCQKEIEENNVYLAQIPYMNEDDLWELSSIIFPLTKKPQKAKKSSYSSIEIDGVTISFGKNSHQNEELTFKHANKNHVFLHIKDYPGSHIVIEEENPSNQILLFASEMALILSGQVAGDIQYTLVKNVKKGSSPGQVLLPTFQLITLREIRSSTYEELQKL